MRRTTSAPTRKKDFKAHRTPSNRRSTARTQSPTAHHRLLLHRLLHELVDFVVGLSHTLVVALESGHGQGLPVRLVSQQRQRSLPQPRASLNATSDKQAEVRPDSPLRAAGWRRSAEARTFMRVESAVGPVLLLVSREQRPTTIKCVDARKAKNSAGYGDQVRNCIPSQRNAHERLGRTGGLEVNREAENELTALCQGNAVWLSVRIRQRPRRASNPEKRLSYRMHTTRRLISLEQEMGGGSSRHVECSRSQQNLSAPRQRLPSRSGLKLHNQARSAPATIGAIYL